MDLPDLLATAKRDLLKPMQRDPSDLETLAESARFGHVIEYIRAVHAEMAALISAARRGVAVAGCTLYSTAFPCHECAKHIVASGIRTVYFIEPYPKSRVAELFFDSIVIDGPADSNHVAFIAYIGVSPARYTDLFLAPVRRDQDGEFVEWENVRGNASSRLGNPMVSYLERETEQIDLLNNILLAKGIT
jgi:tRNA(Arg) A34 adenosine deaminase TadA